MVRDKTLKFVQKGNFSRTDSFFEKALEVIKFGELDKWGREGVKALSAHTPEESGETADSWYYTITREDGQTTITWCNSHVEDGVNIAIILQYGHGTRHGGYVQGRDFINPAIQPLFDKIAATAWEELK